MSTIVKRLSIPLSESQHKAIKSSASLAGQTIKEYILARLFSENKTLNNKTLTAMKNMEEGRNLTVYDDVNDFLNEVKTINEKYNGKNRQSDEKGSRADGKKREKS